MFNGCIDIIMNELDVRAMDRDSSLKNKEVKFTWIVNQLVFVDDATLARDSVDKFNIIIFKIGKFCERRKLKINVGEGC